ncbi:MAG: hypothetical protein N2049_07850 [Anaerolineales bacterium]|nr:hypothetical protein [Anaerolineales bacterium]MCX7609112.1 hypothetical protein [Anaerolineales bacterium]MDW8227086.1 hypothetical protein [Anaerolineales bacterium]
MKQDPRQRYFTTTPDRSRLLSLRLEPWLGLLLGFACGLWVAWVLAPRAQVDSTPAALRTDYRDRYRLLIASAYAATGDLGRARVRLALLQDPDPIQALLDQSRRAAEGGQSAREVFLLAALAEALQQPPTPETLTSSPTPSPLPTLTTFRLVVQALVCEPTLPAGLTQIETRNAAGQPLPGVPILVRSAIGEQRLVTGLKPERGLGYADLLLQAGVTYYIQAGEGGESAMLALPSCTAQDGSTYPGGYLLIFEQP